MIISGYKRKAGGSEKELKDREGVAGASARAKEVEANEMCF